MALAAVMSCWILSLASHVAVCSALVASWTCSLAHAGSIAARWLFGPGSPEAAVVGKLFHMTVYHFLLPAAVAFVLAVALLLHCLVMAQLLLRREIAGDSGARVTLPAAREHDHEGAGHDQNDGPGGVIDTVVALLAPLMFFAQAEGSSEGQLYYVLTDAAFFVASLAYCFIMFPRFAIKVMDGWGKVRGISALLTAQYLYLVLDA